MNGTFLIKNYYDELRNIPEGPGVYFLELPNTMSYDDLVIRDVIISHPNLKVGDKNGPISRQSLNSKIDRIKEKQKSYLHSNRLYIGETKNLKKRICQYLCYLKIGGDCHRGGRVIGQIDNFDELICKYYEVETKEKAQEEEKQLIDEFESKMGCKPLANLP